MGDIMVKEKLSLTPEEAQLVVTGEHHVLIEVETKMIGHWRHGTTHTTIFRRRGDKKFFRLEWNDSAKDGMTFADMNYCMVATEVFPKTVTTIIYE